MRISIKCSVMNSNATHSQAFGRDMSHLKSLLGHFKYRKDYPGNQRMGAFVVYKNTVIAKGMNQEKTHPLQKKFAVREEAEFIHAEVDAISKAIKILNTEQLAKATIYIARMKKDGTQGLAKPCQGCANLIKSLNIKRIVWTEG